MRAHHLLISLAGLLLGFFLMICGAFFLLVPYVSPFQKSLKILLNQETLNVSCMGLGGVILGLFFLILIGLLSRRRYFLLQMGQVSLQDQLIAQLAHVSLQEVFPEQSVECDVIIKKKQEIEFVVQIPFIRSEEREETFKEIEREFTLFLQKQCQYERPFILNVNFFPEVTSRYPSE